MGMLKSKDERAAAREAAQQKQADKQQALAEKIERKAREQAAKKGLNTDGALAVAHNLNKEAAYETLIVWADRVELHNHGKVATLLRAGKGVESMPISSVASVETRNDGIFAVLEVHGSGNSIKVRMSQPEAPRVRQVISDLVQGSKEASTGTPTGTSIDPRSPIEQLRHLAELRDAGILTAEEFEAKKAELLRRM